MAKKVLIATYSRTGTTAKVAEALAELLPAADQFTIEVAPGTFSDEMTEVLEQATKQTETGNFLPLSKAVPDISSYDLILVGSPVWNGAPATPIHSFLANLQGYQGIVAPFYTFGGDPGIFEKTFKEWAGNLQVKAGHGGDADLAA
ncbi:flavodoxin [Pediococcus acidilactici]